MTHPQANHYLITDCNDPGCGIHIVLMDVDNNPIAEGIVAEDNLPRLIAVLQTILKGRLKKPPGVEGRQ